MKIQIITQPDSMSGDIIGYFYRNYDLHTHTHRNRNTFLYKEKYLYIAPIIPSFMDNVRAHALVRRTNVQMYKYR